MNMAAVKTALANSKLNCICNIQTRVSLFHSTAVLDRRRRNRHSDHRNHNNSKRSQMSHVRDSMLHSLNAYTDSLFKSWWEQYRCDDNDPSLRRGPTWFRSQHSADNFQRDGAGNRGSQFRDRSGGDGFYYPSSEDDEYDPSSIRGPSWFRRAYSANNFRRVRAGNRGSRRQRRHWSKRGFQFCDNDEDIDMETIFRSAFTRGNAGFFYWSFTNGENSQWWSSSGKSGSSWHWRSRFEKEYESDCESSDTDLSSAASERLALGLTASGPIKLEDVKTAYRSCALKWHPDRHQGSSKAVAEEKFKLCSAAYQSLCDKLTD